MLLRVSLHESHEKEGVKVNTKSTNTVNIHRVWRTDVIGPNLKRGNVKVIPQSH